MALEQLRAEIAMLIQQMEDEPEDIHELHRRIRDKLSEIKAMGMPLPDDLVTLERRLDAEESRGVSAQPPQRPVRRAAKRPTKRAKRAAKKAKRPAKAAKAAKKSRSTKKSKRPAKKARRSSAKKSRRSSSRRR
jgi:hypothetical protein